MVLDLKSVCPGCLESLCFMEQVTVKNKQTKKKKQKNCTGTALYVYNVACIFV